MPNTPFPVKYSWHMASAMITLYKYQTRLSRALIEAMVALHPLAPRSGTEPAQPSPNVAPADTGADVAPSQATVAPPHPPVQAAPAAPAAPAVAETPVWCRPPQPPAPHLAPAQRRRGVPGPALQRGPMRLPPAPDAALQQAQGGYAALSVFMSARMT